MKNNKILILLILLLQGVCCAGFAQCNEGQQNKVDSDKKLVRDSGYCALGKAKVYQPLDPNEIIGLEGYNAPESTDTLRWVSATQSLVYTSYFENDAELAMAAASASRFRKSFMATSSACVHDFMLEIPLAHCVRGGIVPPPFGIKPPKKTQSDSNL